MKLQAVMDLKLTIGSQHYQAALDKPYSIAITLLPNGEQPSHFGVAPCTSETIVAGSFIGDTNQGGSCNCSTLILTPHCNGTHTESIAHILNQDFAAYRAVENPLFCCVLVSIEPVSAAQSTDQYYPNMDTDNKVITRAQLEQALSNYQDCQLKGLAIRTLPNLADKLAAKYDQRNYPVYLTNDAMNYIVERGVKHLLVDFPSVDKMYDEGALSNHRLFWNIPRAHTDLTSDAKTDQSITEMIYVKPEIIDGFYLCNLQLPQINSDAVPSRPVLFKLNCLNE